MSNPLGPLVLVVEPHRLFRELMVEVIEQIPFARVAQADNAISAIDLASKEVPTLVLLDATLPDLAAMETVSRLRAVAPTAAVVLVGDHPIEAYREVAASSGVSVCLDKDGLGVELLPALLRLSSQTLPTGAQTRHDDVPFLVGEDQ